MLNSCSRAFAAVEKYFLEQYEGIMPSLYILLRGLLAISSADENTMLFNAPDASGTSAIFGSRILNVSHVRDFVLHKLLDVTEQLDRLTFRQAMFTVSPTELIYDEPRCRNPGYSFIQDNRNSWNSKPTVLEYLLTNPEIFAQFGYINPAGKVVWKPGPCHKYMDAIHHLQMDLFVLTVLTFGEPGRGTELAAHLLNNVAGGSIRNVFMLFNLFCLRGSYNKTSHASHEDKTMARIPIVSVGRAWIRFLAFLRPLFIVWQTHFRPHMAFNASHYLLAGNSRPVTSSDISVAIAQVAMKEWTITLPLSLWRQYMAFMTSCNQSIFFRAQDKNRPSDAQFGHTGSMDRTHYGGDERTPLGLDYTVFMTTARTSAASQMMFGYEPDLMVALSAGSERQNAIVDKMSRILQGSSPPDVQSSSSYPTVESIVEAIKSRLLPEMVLYGNRSLAQSLAAVVNLLAPSRVFRRGINLVPAAEHFAHPYFLTQLRSFMGTSKPLLSFSNAAQAEVTKLMYEGRQHIAYISGTGMFQLVLCSQ